MIEKFHKFTKKADIVQLFQELKTNEHFLDIALEEIEGLVRGNVKPEDTIRRSKIGSYFTSSIQQINNFIDKRSLKTNANFKTELNRMAYKADKVLRENIVLQTKPPLDVIKFTNVPIRHSYSAFGGREQRWGYGLHKNLFNEDGNSITLASMPPRYTQSIHNHTLSEYCLILGSKAEGIYFPGKTKEKIYSTNKSQIFHFSATTPHTLKNPTTKHKLNMTFKQPAALLDWKPVTNLNSVKIVRARIIKGNLSIIDKNQTKKIYRIQDKFYNYTIEILKLAKGTTYSAKHTYDQFIFVINGRFNVSHKNINKDCKKNDFVVIDKNTEYTIVTKTTCRLYTVKT